MNPGSEPFSPLSCHDASKFEVLSVFSLEETICRDVQRQARICTTLPSFRFTCRLLFIISTRKLVVSRNFLSIRIVLSCFYVLISDFFRLPYTRSMNSLMFGHNYCPRMQKKSSSVGLTCVATARRRLFSLVRGFLRKDASLVVGQSFCTMDKIELYQSESLNHKLLYRVYYGS